MSFSPSVMRLAFTAASEENTSPTPRSTGEAMRGREGTVVQRRAADAWRNSALLHNVITRLRRGLMGNPWPITRDDEAREWFWKWAKWCGYRHQFGSLPQQLGRFSHSGSQDGEAYIQRIYTTGKASSNGLLLQVWPGHLRDKGKQSMSEGAQADITDGIEFEDGMPVAVWMRSESSDPSRPRYSNVRIPFSDLICIRFAPDPQLTAGMPYVHASIEADAQLNDLAATELVKQRTQACLAAILLAKPSISAQHLEIGPRITDSEGNEVHELEPGTFAIAHNTESIHFSDPSQGSLATEEYKAQVAAGVNMPLELIGGKLGDASFSSARYASLTERETINEFRIHCGIEEALSTLIDWWKEAELLSGRDFMGATFNWLQAPLGTINPRDEVTANKEAVMAGFKSRVQVIREMGRDPEEVADEIRADPIPVPFSGGNGENSDESGDPAESADNNSKANDAEEARRLRLVDP